MRYFIGFLITIGLIIVLIFMLFGGSDNGENRKPTEVTPRTLSSYADTNAVTSMTLDGVINANEEHRQVLILVDRSNVRFQVIKGYNGEVIQEQVFANSTSAYENFLEALNHAGFTQTDNSKELSNEKGYCPLGNRYIFTMSENGAQLERSWATSCGGVKTYLGALQTTIDLFQAQVPNYDTLTQDIDLQ